MRNRISIPVYHQKSGASGWHRIVLRGYSGSKEAHQKTVQYSSSPLQNMPDPLKTISEMKRIGKPQAIFAVTGLKKKFTQEGFINLLKTARLKVSVLETDQRLKGHIAVCTNAEQDV